MDKIFVKIYESIQQWRILFFALLVVLLSSCIYVATKISFEEDITKILPNGEEKDVLAKVLQQLNFSDKITVMIRAENEEAKEELSEIANELIDSLSNDTAFYNEIQGGIETDQINETFEFVNDHLPLFLDQSDYEHLQERLTKDSIDARMESNYNTLISPTGIVAREFILKDPLGFSFIGLEKLKSLGVSQDFQLNDGFITTADGSTLLLFISPAFEGTDTKNQEEFVKRLYQYQSDINQSHKGVAELTYFGSPFIALANANQIKSDIKNTVLLSVSLLLLLLILHFRKLYIPILIFIPAIFGATLAIAIIYFIHPNISAISISIGAVLLGITVDYAIHIITHFRESSDIKTLYKNIAKPLLACSATTSMAFFCLTLVDSAVLNDLGLFAGISVIVSSLAALIIIPHLYIPKIKKRETILDRFAAYSFDRNKVLIVLSSIAVIVGIFSFPKVQFNSDISELNFVPNDMKNSEQQLENLGSLGSKSLYLAVYGHSVDEVLAKNNELESKLNQFQNDGLLLDYTSIGKFVFDEKTQQQKIDNWNLFWEKNDKSAIVSNIDQAAQKLGFSEDAFDELEETLNKKFEPITISQYQEFETIPIHEFLNEKDGFYTLSTLVKTDSIQRQNLINQLKSDELVIIDRKQLNEQLLGQIKDDFKTLMNYSFVIVFVILLLFFKRIELALLSITPIILTGLVTTGFIYILGLELNVFSLIVTTLILGVGVDFSIFMTSGLQHRYTTGEDNLKTYRASIVLAILTTVLSIGVLVFAKHPALKSISAIALTGMLTAMLITFILYPKLFYFFIEKRQEKGKSPTSLRLTFFSLISFLYYGLGGILFSIFGIIFIQLIPGKKDSRVKWYRNITSKFFKTVMRTSYSVKNNLNNPHNESFEKPAIIIPNHSSFLDTLSMGFLKTPFIFLVNDWVYNSPIFGKVVQLAGYYPVSSGIENGEKQLIEFIEKGYSLIIFPEGTRSTDGSIKRFHKGAFMLAEKYDIDITPIYIHGNSDLLPKGDFIIYEGQHTLEIGKRFNVKESYPNSDVKTITKAVNAQFRKDFQQTRYKLENENYFKPKIYLNFLYKEEEVNKVGKQEFETNKHLYHELNPLIPEKANIFRIGDDLGIWDLMLSFQQANRKITTHIFDEKKRKIANQSYLCRTRKITYLDQISSKNAETLLITHSVDQENLKTLVQINSLEQIIIIDNSVDKVLFLENGFVLYKEANRYQLLRRV